MYDREYQRLYYHNVTARKKKGLSPIPREQWETPPKERTIFKTDQLRNLYIPIIKSYWLEHHHAPTIRAIQELTGVSSTSVVHEHLLKLKKAGYVLFDEAIPGTIRLPNMRVTFDETVGSNSAA